MILPQWKTASRIFAVLLSIAIIGMLVWRLDTSRLAHTLRFASPGWFVLAVLANGCLFLPAALRWHLILKVANCAVNFLTTLRCVIIGHFFYVGLFGALGGDSMRSICYSRWYGRSLPAVLSTAPLDRLLGFAGLILFAGFGATVARFPDGLNLSSAGWLRNPWSWIVAATVLVALWLSARSIRGNRFASEFFSSLKSGLRAFVDCPRVSATAILCGVLVQVALSAVLALCLRSVWPGPLPWTNLVWTFPLISLLGGLPITVAGIGTREAAALSLFGLYGISPEAAITASLLSLISAVLWASCGAVLYWLHPKNAQASEALQDCSATLGSEHPKRPVP